MVGLGEPQGNRLTSVTTASTLEMFKSKSDFITVARKLGRFVTNSKITPDEYAENLLLRCTTCLEIDEETARLVASEVPTIARDRLIEEISRVIGPNYRYPELHYDGPGPSEECREEQRRVLEIRIRAFATQLGRTL